MAVLDHQREVVEREQELLASRGGAAVLLGARFDLVPWGADDRADSRDVVADRREVAQCGAHRPDSGWALDWSAASAHQHRRSGC